MKTKYPIIKGKEKSLFTVREARAHFSEVLKMAAGGGTVTITVHGVPTVQIVPARSTEKPLKVNRRWLKSMKPNEDKRSLSENLVRRDRNGRG